MNPLEIDPEHAQKVMETIYLATLPGARRVCTDTQLLEAIIEAFDEARALGATP